MELKEMKLDKNTYPIGHGAGDFRCFGPPAVVDAEFSTAMIADLGYFDQSNRDSAKYYHGAVVQSKIDQRWYAYFEWGRTGASNNSFQFNSAISKEDAHAVFESQMHSKNDKRGQWVEVAGIRTLGCKPGKDCYLVRPLATRVTGLPDAKTIVFNDSVKIASMEKENKKVAKKSSNFKKVDPPTIKLLHDLGAGTIAFTRTNMADASIPTQTAIDEARQILDAATIRVVGIGEKIEDQVADKDLIDMTGLLYKRIPKKKDRNTSVSTWILSSNNIVKWREDLDAFESALYTKIDAGDNDPYAGMNIDIEHIDPKSPIGRFLNNWWVRATMNRHPNMGDMEIVNAWTVNQHDGILPFMSALSKINANHVEYRPLHQPPERIDISNVERQAFERSNVILGFHGSRTCNIIGILRKRLMLPSKLEGVKLTLQIFGQAIYVADDIKKSCQYVSLPGAMWSRGEGSIPGRNAFMFVMDAIIGNPYLAPDKYNYSGPPNGIDLSVSQIRERHPWLRSSSEKEVKEIVGKKYHSIFGKGAKTPGSAKSTAALQNNEWMIYDESQHRLRYLIEFREAKTNRFH